MNPKEQPQNEWAERFDKKFLSKEADWSDYSFETFVKEIKAFIRTERQSLLNEILAAIPEKKEVELEIPRLFQANSTPNEAGGYSSVPFYCSLCGMNELNIQDNKIKAGVRLLDKDANYACHCSVWDSPTGGKWLCWYDKEKANQLLLETPSEDNLFNQALQSITDIILEIKKKI